MSQSNRTTSDRDAEQIPKILYEGDGFLVASKPPGILTQAPPGIDSFERQIMDFLSRRDGKTDKPYLGVPHRLDRPASGAMVFALRRRTARQLSEQFEARTVKKIYWACVAGPIQPLQGIWRDYIRKIPDQARAEVASSGQPDARAAVLRYRVLQLYDWGCWLQIELETGRTHQIRVQAATRGHPLLGDAQYGSNVAFGPQHDDQRLRAIALHARELEFRHPATQQTLSVTAPAPAVWREFIDLEENLTA